MNAPQSLQHHFTSMQGIFQHMIPDFNETAITEKGSNFFISYWLKLIWENGILPENCTIASLLTGLFLLFWRSIFSSPYSNFKLGMKLMKEQLTGQSTKQSQGWRLPCCPVPFSQSAQLLSRVWLFANPWITACQASLFITNSWSLLKLMSIRSVMPSSHLILCHPLLLLPPIPPSIRVFSNESTLCMRRPKYWSFSFSISPSMNTQDWSPLGWLVGSPSSPRDSQESSPTPQFKNINSSVLSFLYSPTLTSIHDHLKNHSFDQTDLCWPSNVSAF